jgi:putative copper resistance protein D
MTAGLPAPTLDGVWTAWRLDPLIMSVLIIGAAGYAVGMRLARRRGRTWPVRRAVAFFGPGLGSLAVLGLGWPAVYARALFSVYALQLVMLLMVVPLLVAFGRPVELAMTALGAQGTARLRHLLNSGPGRVLTVPIVGPLLLAVVPFAVFFTQWYPETLRHPAAASATHLLLIIIGLVALVPLWEAGTIAAQVPYAIALLIAFIELLADALPGIVIRLDTHVIAAAELARAWPPALLQDQQLGGNVLWCIGEAIDVPFLAMLVYQWYRSDARQAAQVDRLLDTTAGVGPVVPAAAVDAPSADTMRPWWEQDASVFGDRAGLYQRAPAPPTDDGHHA